jgi:hypothetical protein
MRILEIGIGRGGSYIQNDPAETLRIGIDRKFTVCSMVHREWRNVQPVLSTLFYEGKPKLPFASESVDQIEFRFPHDDILYWLTTENTEFWVTMRRVLKPQGNVTILFDVPPDAIRTVHLRSEDRDVRIYRPEDHLWKLATNAGFSVNISKLTRQQVYDTGSIYGKCAAHWMKLSNDAHQAFLLKADKL